MPELPEVHTTVEGLKQTIIGLTISDVWTNYKSDYPPYRNQIKNPAFFATFKKTVTHATVTDVERRHKNILIHLDNNHTILIHMKMTGHLLFGHYQKVDANSKSETLNTKQTLNEKHWKKESWRPHPDESNNLHDPFNRHIRLVFSFSNGKHLAFSDMRKFAKVTLIPTKELDAHEDIASLGPEPLERSFTFPVFKKRILSKPTAPIKSVLMDQTVIAGIGNIYSDEILFAASVHPESTPENIPEEVLKDIFSHIKPLLKKGIKFGGDSTSDYRAIDGSRGKFQGKHQVYRETGKPCPQNDDGIIKRKVIRGRSAHFCPAHQKKY